MKKSLIVIVIFLVFTGTSHAVRFEELDKAPEGAHYGQMLLGVFGTMAYPMGNIINAEQDFVRFSTYTFNDNNITKLVTLSHLHFSYGIIFEYMPINYLGVKFKGKRTSLIQRTNFGSDFKNWSTELYNDLSMYVGPSLHTTKRKRWDITLTPFIGYAFGRFKATPVAAKIFNTFTYNLATGEFFPQLYLYTYGRKKISNNVAFGAEVNITIYFTGGLFISLGADYSLYMLNFDGSFYMINPVIKNTYNTDIYYTGSSSLVHAVGGIISVGYAFSN